MIIIWDCLYMQQKEVEAVRQAVTTDTCCLATPQRWQNREQLKVLNYLSTSHPHPGALFLMAPRWQRTIDRGCWSKLFGSTFWIFFTSFSPPAKSRKILIVNLLLFFTLFLGGCFGAQMPAYLCQLGKHNKLNCFLTEVVSDILDLITETEDA